MWRKECGHIVVVVLCAWVLVLFTEGPHPAMSAFLEQEIRCATYKPLTDPIKTAIVFGYFEGVQTSLSWGMGVDVLVPPEDERHPVWWVLPKGGATVKSLVADLSAYCRQKGNEGKKLLDVFRSLAFKKEGRPLIGISYDRKVTYEWKKILGPTNVTCSLYLSSGEQIRRAIVYGYFLGTEAMRVALKTKREHWFVWPQAGLNALKAVEDRVFSGCNDPKEAKTNIRTVLWVAAVETAMETSARERSSQSK